MGAIFAAVLLLAQLGVLLCGDEVFTDRSVEFGHCREVNKRELERAIVELPSQSLICYCHMGVPHASAVAVASLAVGDAGQQTADPTDRR